MPDSSAYLTMRSPKVRCVQNFLLIVAFVIGDENISSEGFDLFFSIQGSISAWLFLVKFSCENIVQLRSPLLAVEICTVIQKVEFVFHRSRSSLITLPDTVPHVYIDVLFLWRFLDIKQGYRLISQLAPC